MGEESGSRVRNRISKRRRSCHFPSNYTSLFELMRIPLNATSTVKTRESTFTPTSLFFARTRNMPLPSSLLLSFLLQGCGWFLPSLPSHTEAASLPVAQQLTFQRTPLTPGRVGCTESGEGVRNKTKRVQLTGHRLDELQAPAVSLGTTPPRSASIH